MASPLHPSAPPIPIESPQSPATPSIPLHRHSIVTGLSSHLPRQSSMSPPKSATLLPIIEHVESDSSVSVKATVGETSTRDPRWPSLSRWAENPIPSPDLDLAIPCAMSSPTPLPFAGTDPLFRSAAELLSQKIAGHGLSQSPLQSIEAPTHLPLQCSITEKLQSQVSYPVNTERAMIVFGETIAPSSSQSEEVSNNSPKDEEETVSAIAEVADATMETQAEPVRVNNSIPPVQQPQRNAWALPPQAPVLDDSLESSIHSEPQSATEWPSLADAKKNKSKTKGLPAKGPHPPDPECSKTSTDALSQFDIRLPANSKRFPWAARMNQATRNLQRVTTPTYLDDGTPKVIIPKHILLQGLENQKEYVIGQFYRCSLPSGGLIHVVLNRIWGRNCKIFVRKLGDSSYIFHIPDAATRTWVLQRGLWHVDNCIMFVAPWSSSASLELPEITTIPVWVSLKNIPSNAYSLDGIKFIASGLGEPMLSNKPRLDPTMLGEAKIMVEMELDKPFPQRVAAADEMGNTTMVDVEYSWLPLKCSRCGHLGHKESRCLLPLNISCSNDKQNELTTPSEVLKSPSEPPVTEAATAISDAATAINPPAINQDSKEGHISTPISVSVHPPQVITLPATNQDQQVIHNTATASRSSSQSLGSASPPATTSTVSSATTTFTTATGTDSVALASSNSQKSSTTAKDSPTKLPASTKQSSINTIEVKVNKAQQSEGLATFEGVNLFALLDNDVPGQMVLRSGMVKPHDENWIEVKGNRGRGRTRGRGRGGH